MARGVGVGGLRVEKGGCWLDLEGRHGFVGGQEGFYELGEVGLLGAVKLGRTR